MESIDFLDDEIDLVKLVSSNADVTNQYILFEGSNRELYAINVAKVEELFVYKREKILENNQNPLIRGMMEIRSQITPLIFFDAWYKNPSLDEENYELMIFCHFSSRYVSLVVKQVIDIVSIEPQQMQSSSEMNELSSFVAKIQRGAHNELCTIFDTDKLLYDVFGQTQEDASQSIHKIESKKSLLFADDSILVRKMAQSSFLKLGIHFEIFSDGEELLEALEHKDVEDIGLFLLDLEMPRKSGLDVIDALQKEPKYSKIPIVVHTNMANATIQETLRKKGVTQVIGKIDFKTIESSIAEYML